MYDFGILSMSLGVFVPLMKRYEAPKIFDERVETLSMCKAKVKFSSKIIPKSLIDATLPMASNSMKYLDSIPSLFGRTKDRTIVLSTLNVNRLAFDHSANLSMACYN